MSDAIDLLLKGKKHPNVYKLLKFHHDNPDFLPRIVAEFRLLKRLGRKAGSIESLVHFLRWEQHWRGDGDFEIDDQLTALAGRVCTLLWPDIDGMMRFHSCDADEILGTRIQRRTKRYGCLLRPSKHTLSSGCCFLAPEPDSSNEGLVRPVRSNELPFLLRPPEVPVLDRPATFHARIAEAAAASAARILPTLVNRSPNRSHPLLIDWLHHAERQPEMFAFMHMKLQQREVGRFSARSILEYCRWSIRRAAETHKDFTLPSRFNGLYCRAVVMANPKFNGFCHFKDDGNCGRSNRLLGCTLAELPLNGEPYCRLEWPEEEQ